MTEIVNKPYGTSFKSMFKTQKYLCLSGDLTSSCEVDTFGTVSRTVCFYGMAEQNMMSFAGGLAMVVYSFHSHIWSVCLPKTIRPITALLLIQEEKLELWVLPGITTPAGMTHQEIEDISVMRTIPNMTVIETGDATEVESICQQADSIDGPVYCQILEAVFQDCLIVH